MARILFPAVAGLLMIIINALPTCCQDSQAQHNTRGDAKVQQLQLQFNRLLHEVQQLSTKTKQQEQVIQELASKNEEQDQLIQGLVSKNTEQEQVIQQLRSKEQDEVIQHQEQEIGELKQQLSNMHNKLDHKDDETLGQQLKETQEHELVRDSTLEVQRVQQRLEQVEARLDQVEQLKQAPSQGYEGSLKMPGSINDTVAFSAYTIVDGGAIVYNEDQRIIFNSTHYNSGHYNPDVSIFECPVDGLYYFVINIQFNLEATESFKGSVNLMKDSTRLAIARGRTHPDTSDSNIGHASNSAIAPCSAGQLVYVQADQISRIFHSIHSSFSGMLLSI